MGLNAHAPDELSVSAGGRVEPGRGEGMQFVNNPEGYLRAKEGISELDAFPDMGQNEPR